VNPVVDGDPGVAGRLCVLAPSKSVLRLRTSISERDCFSGLPAGDDVGEVVRKRPCPSFAARVSAEGRTAHTGVRAAISVAASPLYSTVVEAIEVC